MAAKVLRVGKVVIGGKRPVFILGPCVIESEKFVWRMARKIAQACASAEVDFIFKASYDKANRSSISSYRGPGLEEGLRVLANIKKRTGLPILTDVHEVSHVAPVAEVCDVLQIPAFLSRQTDLLTAAGRSGRVVNIKKGQFLSPSEIGNAAVRSILGSGEYLERVAVLLKDAARAQGGPDNISVVLMSYNL